MPIPLYGFVQGDSLGLFIMAEDDETIEGLSQRLQSAASVRVKPQATCNLVYRGNIVDPGMKVSEAGLQALDRFDVVRKE